MKISEEVLFRKGQERGKMMERTKWKGNSNGKEKRRNKSQGQQWEESNHGPLFSLIKFLPALKWRQYVKSNI